MNTNLAAILAILLAAAAFAGFVHLRGQGEPGRDHDAKPSDPSPLSIAALAAAAAKPSETATPAVEGALEVMSRLQAESSRAEARNRYRKEAVLAQLTAKERHGQSGLHLYFGVMLTANFDRPVRAVKGTIWITDVFGDLPHPHEMKTGHLRRRGDEQYVTFVRPHSTGFARLIADEKTLRDTPISDLQAVFWVETVVFEDGSLENF